MQATTLKSEKTAVFIGGSGRSGTSFLGKLIGSHPKFSYLPETKFLVRFPVARDFPRMLHDTPRPERGRLICQMQAAFINEFWSFPDWPERGLHQLFEKTELFEVLPLLDDLAGLESLQQIEEGYGFFINALFSQYSNRYGTPYWVEKTPGIELYVSHLTRWFPKLKLINIYRDGRDVACSVVTQDWGPNDHCSALDWWAHNTVNGIMAGEDQSLHTRLNIRLEDLIFKQEEMKKTLLRFIGLEPNPEDLPLEAKSDSVGRWRNELPADAVAYAHTKYGDLLTTLGYPVE